MSRHIIDLPCIADMYVDEANPNTNYGSATSLKAGWLNDTPQKIAYFRFNYLSYPARKRFVSAELLIYSEIARSNGSLAQISVYPTKEVNYEWDEYTSTFNTGHFTGLHYYNFDSIPLNQYIEIGISNIYNQKNSIDWVSDLSVLYYQSGLSAGTTYIQVSSRETAHPPILRIVYDDVPPDQPIPKHPVGNYVDNSSVIRFTWDYNSSVGGLQKKFDLMWSEDGTTWNAVSQTTANNYYDMPSETLTSGNIYWKIKTYNEYDEASPESNINTFYAIGKPDTPSIVNVTSSTARPTVSWISEEQQTYQIQILQDDSVVYDSSEIASMSIKTHKISKFLQDGNYTAKLRTKNEYSLWSEWASIGFAIVTTKPTEPSLVLARKKYNITAISSIGTNSYLLLYRSEYNKNDFKCIYKSTTNDITDNKIESNKRYQYFVRAVNSSEAYNDSDILDVYAPTISKSIISPVSDLNNVFEINYNLGERPSKNLTKAMVTTSNYFTGRENPVTEFSEHSSQSVNLGFYIKLDTNYNQLVDIYNLKDVVLYRDGRRKFYGTISGFESKDHRAGYIIGFSIMQVDFDEEIEV